MDDGPRFYVLGVSVEAWTRRWGVVPFSYPCSECGRECTTTLPYAQGTLRGLQAPPCPCGNERTPFGFVRAAEYGDLLSGIDPTLSHGRRRAPRACPSPRRPKR